jgi:hypothetical protein
MLRVVESFMAKVQAAEFETQAGWKTVLVQQLSLLKAKNNSEIGARAQAFQPPIELEFIEGLQTDSKVVLGYGPRKFGGDVLDIEIQDPISPDVAFELFPEADGSVVFKTSHPELVYLNDESVSAEKLTSGDQIRIGSTLIKVKFLA